MDEDLSELTLGRNTDFDQLGKTVLGLFDQPAYMRRALAVEDAIAGFTARLRRQREEWLDDVRRVAQIGRIAVQRRPGKDTNEIDEANLAILLDSIGPPSRPVPPPLWLPRPRRAWGNLAAAIDRFNERWSRWIDVVDLSEVNHKIENYNRHYLLEKECAFRSPRVAARGFVPMTPLDRDWVRAQFPLLPRLTIGAD